MIINVPKDGLVKAGQRWIMHDDAGGKCIIEVTSTDGKSMHGYCVQQIDHIPGLNGIEKLKKPTYWSSDIYISVFRYAYLEGQDSSKA